MGGSNGGGSRLARCEVSINASRRLPRRIMTIQQATSSARMGLPRQVSLAGGKVVVLRTMERWDRHEVTTFVRALPPDALLVMPMDITDEVAADEWIAALESGRAFSVLACEGDRLVGYAGLRRGAAPWTQHLGEFSLLVLSGWPTIELGQHLCRELVGVALDLGLRKIVTQMRSDDEDARVIFADIGFRPEALLVDQVIDEHARTYDLLIMSCTLAGYSQPTPVHAAVIDGEEESTVPDLRDQQGLPPSEPTRVPAFAASLVGAPTATWVAEPEVLAEAPVPAPPGRPRRARRGYVVAAAFGAVALLALGAVYLTTSQGPSRQSLVLGATAPLAVSNTASLQSTTFMSTHEGSGAVFLPVARPAVAVRVGVDPGVIGTWFWCIESSFGMPLADHYCATAGVPEPGTGEFVAQTVLHVDPTWPSDALYFIQMYCEGACVWHVDAAPVQ